ncbi:cytochrome P450 [Novosphingobium nitrogenifigens DSM 19370]|uniref:Cytochrome P450 n=1 Tax=Novosphingobium nitrogenifigens DSM 19370 TaxID=983920 RepID=F1Z4F0_9SPHN|nr:cytochrome P450 [Novosphingobium nitrogenifigens]EGD60560.1 cytochrome P450 [Novosphingobium nitrogenifigens DSM 19370]
MATMLAPETGFSYRTSPTAYLAFEEWLRANPDRRPVHTHPWDVSRSDIYVNDTWGPIFAQMRAQAPVNKVVGTPYGDYWNVTTHKSVLHVESLPELFSSSWKYGGITIGDPPATISPEELAERQLPMFIAMDRPEHTGQRRTVAPAFTPAEMVRMEAEIRMRTRQVLDAVPRGERFDWVDKVSIELTTGMLAILFGFPWQDRRLLTFWSDWAGDVELILADELAEQRFVILQEMAHYFSRLWMERMGAEPSPDLISMMIHSPAMNHMSPQEFMGNLILLIVGGNDTTRNTMSGIVHALDRFPDQRTILENDPSFIPNAVQECIRFVTPLSHMRRTATADTELFGQDIRAGDKVIMWYLSANRDETVFDNPDKLIVTRENARRHLSFGHGIHRCVGARLAELQLRVLLEEMHERRMRVRVDGTVERVRANFVHGFRRLDVVVDRF